jgi:hypothetical protein
MKKQCIIKESGRNFNKNYGFNSSSFNAVINGNYFNKGQNMSKIVLSKKDWLKCDGCGEKIKPVFWGKTWDDESNSIVDSEEFEVDTNFMTGYSVINQLDGGLSFELNGGYDEFFDCVSESDIIKINSCHDCTTKLFALFPNKTKKLNGLHPSRYDDDLCCDFAWHFDFGKEEMIYKSEGKIVIEKQNKEGKWEK